MRVGRNAILYIGLTGCDPAGGAALGDADGRDDAITIATGGKADGLDGATADEIAAVLQLANTADFETLDVVVALDVRAAEGIVAHRDGPDGEPGTEDDDPFDDLAELDAVPWVGNRAFGKMLDHVRANAPSDTPPCLLISEYIEGTLDKNKGIELYNCGDAPVDLSEVALCLVRNDDTDCTLTRQLSAVELPPGDVYTTCRTREGTLNNPWPPVADGCDEELGSVMIYSGDDRMVVLHDPAQTESVHEATVLDALGRIAFRPWWSPWNDIGLKRCRSDRNPGTLFYDEADWFHATGWTDTSSWGLPPVFDCEP